MMNFKELKQPALRRAKASSLLAVGMLGVFGAASSADSSRPPFPAPFLSEHQLVQTGPHGVEFASPSVVDYYGGSWLISKREDGSRLIVDFSKREMTEVKPKDGTYSVVTFSRMADLRRRLAEAEVRPVGAGLGGNSNAADKSTGKVTIKVEEISDKRGPSTSPVESAVLSRASVHHYRATSEKTSVGGAIDAWTDNSIRLTPDGLAALSSFETDVLGELVRHDGEATLANLIGETRKKADGAFVVRTSRPVSKGSASDKIDNIVTRLESIPALPSDLLSIPEGFKRVSHPLEAMTAFAEEEASHDSSAYAK